MKPPGESLTRKPAGPEPTGPHPEGRGAVVQEVPPGAVRYETVDVRPGVVGRALAGLVVATVVVVAVLFPVFNAFKARAGRREPPPPPMGRLDPGRLPAEPRLQTAPSQDLAAIRAEEERLLSSYGWVDEQQGVVHIPIDVAMRIVAERGLPSPPTAASPSPAAASPVPPAPAPSPAAGARAPGERR